MQNKKLTQLALANLLCCFTKFTKLLLALKIYSFKNAIQVITLSITKPNILADNCARLLGLVIIYVDNHHS